MQVCITALNAGPAIDARIPGPIGGIETRAWMFARGLAAQRDVRVQFVVRHPTPLPVTSVDGVQLIPRIDPLYPMWQSLGTVLQRTPGFPGVRCQRWDWRLLWWLPRLALDRLLRGRIYDSDRADPELVALNASVYLTFGVQTHSAVVIRSAHAAGRPAVLMLGSDGDLDPLFVDGYSQRDAYGTAAHVGRYILQTADLVVAQTRAQQLRLQELFGRDSVLLPNPIDAAAWQAAASMPLSGLPAKLQRYVLWVGRAEEVHKRPQLCLEVAFRCPNVTFLMILNPRDAEVEARIRRDAPANVHILERVPFADMPTVISHAAVLLNTSQLEGFSNVFLQAAVSGVPIASLSVGTEFLNEAHAGTCFQGDLESLAREIRTLWSRSEAPDCSAARAYVIEHHDLAGQVQRLLGLLSQVIVECEGQPAAGRGNR